MKPATTTPNASAGARRFHRLCSLQYEGGFLGACELVFDVFFSCLIGGRGTGKTSVIETVRWVLDRPPEDPQRAREFDKLIKFVLGDGVARLKVQTSDGVVYFIERTATDAPRVVNERGEPVRFNLQKGLVFDADLYSQNEIEKMARDAGTQLKLLDKFIQADVDAVNEQIAAVMVQLRDNGSELAQVRGEVDLLREQTAELADIMEKLKGFVVEGSPDAADEVEREQTREVLRKQEVAAYSRMEKSLSDALIDLQRATGGVAGRVSECFDDEILEGPNREVISSLRDAVARGMSDFERKIGEAAAALKAQASDIADSRGELLRRHAVQEKRYKELLSQHEQERGRARERAILLKKQADLQDKAKRLRARQQDADKKERARSQLLQRLSQLRDERHGLRKKVAETLTAQLAPAIRVRVEQFGDTAAYESELGEALKGSKLRYGNIVEKIVSQIPPHELAAIVQRNDRKAIEDQLGVDGDRAARLLLQLRESPNLYRLEVVELVDRPVIELRDGDEYKESKALSTGQRCTTILPILLLDSERPLLIDQPEDNLDNAYIYETVVKSIHRAEGKRQLIFVSHNANIPVLGGANRVFVLESTGRQARIKAAGTVDEVKGDIETLLEGGSEAFMLRKQRYGY